MKRDAVGGTLVLGGGFAGAYVARLLGRRGATIVSPQNSMLYTPLLPEAASGTLEPRHVVVPLRQMCPHADLVLGSVASLDLGERTVAVESIAGPLELGYERLVVALGAVSRVFPVPGLAEHGRGFKDLADAIAFRNHVLERLDAAAAGGGPAPSSASSSSAPATRASRRSASSTTSSRRRSAYYPTLRDVPQRWVLVEAAPQILAEIPPRLGHVRREAARAARDRDPRRDDARLVRRRDRRSLRRHGDPAAHARLDGGSEGESAARATRPAARRARPGARGLARCGSTGSTTSGRSATAQPSRTRPHPARLRPADLPARAPPGAPAREEPRPATRSRTPTGCSARWRRWAASRGSPT